MEHDGGEPEEVGLPEVGPAPSRPPEVQLAGPLQVGASLVVRADQVEISRGAALVVLAEEVRIDRGASLITAAENLSVEKGGSQWLLAREARLQQSGSGIMIAGRVEAADTRVAVLLAGNVEGNVQTVLDARGALRFGAALGATLGVALLLRRLMGGR